MLDERATAPISIDLTGTASHALREPAGDLETQAAGRHVHPTPPAMAASNPPWRWVVTASDGSWLADGWTLTHTGARWAAFRAERLARPAIEPSVLVARVSGWLGAARRSVPVDAEQVVEEPRAA
ncbi:MAG: hypothetical protein S0880_27655 [Actinomycetota bacterium]|nr:hypothetical protein [Actinomycetota bacterium]